MENILDNVVSRRLFDEILNTSIIAKETIFLEETESTNDDVWEYYNKDKNIVIVANKQTKGRGRLGNKWYSNPNESLTFSFNINTDMNANILALITGLAIVRSIKEVSNLDTFLKWPNDIFINNKKMGGILIEAKSKNYVIGMGLNINQNKKSFPDEIASHSTSIRIEKNKSFNTHIILASILNHFEHFYKNFECNKIIENWNTHCMHLDKKINFKYGKYKIEGIFRGLNQNGAAIIKYNNKEKTFNTGIIEL